MTPTDEARIEAIAKALCVHAKRDPDQTWHKIGTNEFWPAWQNYADQASSIIAADPLTQEHAQLKADVVEVLEEARRAIGDHSAPADCYATGPLTGNDYRDLVECPACSFIAKHDALLARLNGGVT